jgi:hypothetical protein
MMKKSELQYSETSIFLLVSYLITILPFRYIRTVFINGTTSPQATSWLRPSHWLQSWFQSHQAQGSTSKPHTKSTFFLNVINAVNFQVKTKKAQSSTFVI